MFPMFAVGLSYMIMGSTHIIVSRLLKKRQPELATRIQKRMFYAGICIVILTIVAFFVPSPYDMILPVTPVLVLALYMSRMAKELIDDKSKPSQ